MFGSARPSVMEFRAPAERAAEERGLDSGDDHAVQLYTTTNSDIPIYMTGEVVPVDSDGMVTPQTNVSGPVVGIDDFRNDARFDGRRSSNSAPSPTLSIFFSAIRRNPDAWQQLP